MADKQILDAVNQLDRTNDNHWTADGLPRIETVRLLAGDSTLTREQVNAAAPDFKRNVPPAPPEAPSAAPAPPAAPALAPTPVAPDTVAAGAEAPELDSGVRGDIGVAAPEVPAAPLNIEGLGAPVPAEDVEGNKLPQPEPLPTAPAADGLPTANEPTAVEGAPGVGLTVEDASGRTGPGGPPTPEIAEGVTTLGYNAFNSEEDDVVDALASVAPSPNAPTGLGGPKQPEDHDGINVDGLRSTADATGETELPSLDRGRRGNPDALPGLQKDLEAASARSDKLRAKVDELTAELNAASAEESSIRAAIEAATPITGHMEAVQGFFGALDREAEARAEMERKLRDSGVDLDALGRLTQRSPLDAAAAKA